METLIVSILTLAALGGEPAFVPIGGHDGIAVFQRKDSALIELAAVGEIDAPPAEVQAALLDYGSHPRVNPRLGTSAVLARRSGEQIVYQYLKLPVIKDRDFTLRITWTDGVPRGLRFGIDGGQGPVAASKAVRMTVMNGRWDLSPTREGNA